ncbi:MAG: UDP-N-acetylmuramate dehydrogenase [Proteobacteria bacterium]|jgi:UDP-N-acetylmuramate dehydrogenase|nr:UDP-N-acetylmuramate dehydrogenase [Pseudomonadota bacterium]
MRVQSQFSLLDYNTLRVPSMAEHWVEVGTLKDWSAAIDMSREQGWSPTILAGGSNVVLKDDLSGLVIHPIDDSVVCLEESSTDVLVEVGAGASWDWWVRYSVSQGWYGLENLVSIPGSCGAAPVQNIGAYGVEVASFIDSVHCIDLQSGRMRELPRDECDFEYRHSVFKAEAAQWGITHVRFRLLKQSQLKTQYQEVADWLATHNCLNPEPSDVLRAVASIRATKLPDVVQYPNVGSFFKNPVVTQARVAKLVEILPSLPVYALDNGVTKLSAAYLIEALGLKGLRYRGCQVSEQHALVLINTQSDRGDYCLELAQKVSDTVYEQFGVVLEREPSILGTSRDF